MLFRSFGLGWVQVIKGDIYKKKARAQQRKIVVEKAARGNIYDRNGKELTRNSTSYELWFSDYDIVLKGNDKQQREKKKLEYIKKAVPLIEQDTKKQNDPTVCAELGWISYYWMIAYTIPGLAAIKVSQFAIFAVLMGFVAERTARSYHKHGEVRFADIAMPILLTAMTMVVAYIFAVLSGSDAL